MSALSRRRFVRGAGLAGLGLLTACWRLPWQAQAPPLSYRVGYLTSTDDEPTDVQTGFNDAFLQGMRDSGYVEVENLVVERRFSAALAAELVALPVDVIFAAGGTIAAVAARQATHTIPIVSPTGDLVGAGLAASLARPGGNVTGLTTISPQLSGKRLELLKEAVPGVLRVAVIWNPASATATRALGETQMAADVLGLVVKPLPVRNSTEVAGAVEAARQDADSLAVMGDPLTLSQSRAIAEYAARSRLPTMYAIRDQAEVGGRLAYGPNLTDQYRRAATYVDRILRGANPAEMPVEQPMTFDFVINLRTAQALALTIPQHVLLQATEIIQ